MLEISIGHFSWKIGPGKAILEYLHQAMGFDSSCANILVYFTRTSMCLQPKLEFQACVCVCVCMHACALLGDTLKH